MADHSRNPNDHQLTGALHVPHRALGAGDGDDSTKAREEFEPKAYYFGAWHLLKQDPFIFLWKIGADFLRAVVNIATLVTVVLVVVLGLGSALDVPQGPLVGLERFIGQLATPQFTIGAAGVLFCAWLASLMIDVLMLSGVWGTLAAGTLAAGTLAAGTRGEPIVRFRTFFENLTTRFPAVLSLRITTLAAQATVALLGLTLFVSILTATTGMSAFADSSVWTRGLLWAAPLTLFAGLAALVRLTMEVAAAPLIIERRTLGEAILVAARLVVRRFAEVYRLLIVAAGLLLVPLFFYWGVLIFGNLTMDVAALAPVNTMLRLFGEFVLFVSSAAIALLFYGAIFLYYAHQMGMIDQIPGSGDGADNGRERASRRSKRPERVGFTQETTLEDLLPDEYPNTVDLADVLREDIDASASNAELGASASSPELGASASSAGEQADLSGDDIFDSDDDIDSNDRD